MEGRPEDRATTVRFTPATRWPPAFVADKVWLRLLVACGELKCWVSSDGVHWGRAFESANGWHARPCAAWACTARRASPVARSGCAACCSANCGPQLPGPRRRWYVGLRWCRTPCYRILPGRLAGWPSRRLPPGRRAAVWSRACAIRALASGVSPTLGMLCWKICSTTVWSSRLPSRPRSV